MYVYVYVVILLSNIAAFFGGFTMFSVSRLVGFWNMYGTEELLAALGQAEVDPT